MNRWFPTSPIVLLRKYCSGSYHPILTLMIGGACVVIISSVLDRAIAFTETFFKSDINNYLIVLVGVVIYYLILSPLVLIWLGSSCLSAYKSYTKAQSARSIWAAVGVGLISVCLAYAYFHSVMVPQLLDVVSAVNGDPNWGKATVALSPAGDTLLVQGPITQETATKFEQTVKLHSRIRILHLESEGGRYDAALRMRTTVQKLRLETYVESKCASACVVVFLAGYERIIYKNAKIGFHQGSVGNEEVGSLNDIIEEEIAMGISEEFLRRAWSTPANQMMYPSTGELLATHAVTKVLNTPLQVK